MLSYNSKLPLFSIHIPKSGGTSLVNILESWFNKSTALNINNHPKLYKYLTPLNLDFLYQRLRGCALYYHYRNEFFNKMPRRVPLVKKYGVLRQNYQSECVHGHFDPVTDEGDLFYYYPEATQMITFLRDPLEMQLSLFFYNRKRVSSSNMYWKGEKITHIEYEGDIDRWVEERDLYMLRFFPFNINESNYKELINQYFLHIGVTERMQKSVDILADKLGYPRQIIAKENTSKRDDYPSEAAIKIFKEKHKLEYLIYNYVLSLNQ